MSAGLFPLLSDIAPFERLVASSGVGLNVNFADPETAAAAFLQRWQKVANELRSRYASSRSLPLLATPGRMYRGSINRFMTTRSGQDAVPFSMFRSLSERRPRPSTKSTPNTTLKNQPSLPSPTPTRSMLRRSMTNFRNVLKRCLVMNDGIGVDAASRILFGSRFPQNLNGTDFTPNYFKNTRNSYRIFFLGSSSGVAERAASRLIEMWRPTQNCRLSERLFPGWRQYRHCGQDPSLGGRCGARGDGQSGAGNVARRKS